MSYQIEWLKPPGAEKWSRAIVTEKRWFKPARVTEVERREERAGKYASAYWYHVGTKILVDGAFDGFNLQHAGLHRKLDRARAREVERIAKAQRVKHCEEQDAERATLWHEARVPRARVVIKNCRANGDIVAIVRGSEES